MLRRQLDVRGELVEAPVSFAERWWNERPVNMDLISSLPKQNHEISLEEFENLRTKAVEDSLHLRSKLPRPENFIVLRLEPQSALQASTVGADFSLTVPGPAVIAASLLRPFSLCRRIPAKCVYTAANTTPVGLTPDPLHPGWDAASDDRTLSPGHTTTRLRTGTTI